MAQPIAGVVPVDMARFGRVVTWGPKRTDGARASRVEEFHAEDLFTETELVPERDGSYRVPDWAEGIGCIGLQWLNERAPATVGLEFEEPTPVPTPDAVRVEGWFGESAWQGNWRRLPGSVRREGRRLVLDLAPKPGAVRTRKVRWVLPVPAVRAAQPRVRLTAVTRSEWATTNLFVQVENPRAGQRGQVIVWNGEGRLNSRAGTAKSAISWNLARPLRLLVCYSLPSPLNSDPTARAWPPGFRP